MSVTEEQKELEKLKTAQKMFRDALTITPATDSWNNNSASINTSDKHEDYSKVTAKLEGYLNAACYYSSLDTPKKEEEIFNIVAAIYLCIREYGVDLYLPFRFKSYDSTVNNIAKDMANSKKTAKDTSKDFVAMTVHVTNIRNNALFPKDNQNLTNLREIVTDNENFINENTIWINNIHNLKNLYPYKYFGLLTRLLDSTYPECTDEIKVMMKPFENSFLAPLIPDYLELTSLSPTEQEINIFEDLLDSLLSGCNNPKQEKNKIFKELLNDNLNFVAENKDYLLRLKEENYRPELFPCKYLSLLYRLKESNYPYSIKKGNPSEYYQKLSDFSSKVLEYMHNPALDIEQECIDNFQIGLDDLNFRLNDKYQQAVLEYVLSNLLNPNPKLVDGKIIETNPLIQLGIELKFEKFVTKKNGFVSTYYRIKTPLGTIIELQGQTDSRYTEGKFGEEAGHYTIAGKKVDIFDFFELVHPSGDKSKDTVKLQEYLEIIKTTALEEDPDIPTEDGKKARAIMKYIKIKDYIKARKEPNEPVETLKFEDYFLHDFLPNKLSDLYICRASHLPNGEKGALIEKYPPYIVLLELLREKSTSYLDSMLCEYCQDLEEKYPGYFSKTFENNGNTQNLNKTMRDIKKYVARRKERSLENEQTL